MIRDVTVSQVLEEAARLWPTKVALTYDERSDTFEELQREIVQTAGRLRTLGIREKDHVVLFAPNLPEWVVLQFALARIGAVLVTANTALGRADLDYLLRDSSAAAIVVGGEVKGNSLARVASEIDRNSLPSLRTWITLEGAEVEGAIALDQVEVGETGEAKPSLDALVNMQYTSGTTGFPKGVMLSSRNIVNNAERTGAVLGLTPDDRVLCQVPLFHCFGCVISVLGAFTHGASLHLTRVFDPQESLRTILRHSVTVIHGVPTMFLALLDHEDAQNPRPTTIRTGIMAGAVCPPSLMKRLIEEWDVSEMIVGYGLTEASPHVTYTPREDPPELRCASIGIPLPQTEVILVDPETGERGSRGEMWIRGEQVMLGYYGKPDQTAETLTEDGWLRSGDLAERDDTGSYRIVGRLKEMILRGGENVYPAEVEEAIRAHPQVQDVAVYGVPDSRLGEQVACAIVPRETQGSPPLDLDTIRGFLSGRIAKTKIPAYVTLVEDFPLTASGKVQRYVLRERFSHTSESQA